MRSPLVRKTLRIIILSGEHHMKIVGNLFKRNCRNFYKKARKMFGENTIFLQCMYCSMVQWMCIRESTTGNWTER